nr:ABC transporter G family member 26 [Ipomoea trifida]
MEHGRHEEIHEDLPLSPPTLGSMQIAGSNGFGHNIDFMPQAYLTSRSSEIDIVDETSHSYINHPLPIFLKFADLEYKVKISQSAFKNPVKAVVSNVASQVKTEQENYKQILKGITGSIGPGEILALMGPSGSGKTTLLRILGGRLRENVKGTITYNDIPYSAALKRRVGFVTQDDVLFPQLTVEETLVFAAFLRLPSDMSKREKYERVEMIIKELGLERCRHTRVGGGFVKGISGGERKRTSIGYEILVDPSLLLLDEPTSGLDSTSANRLLQILQRLSKARRTIITTIHQPSSRTYHMFDKILLISEGSPVYYGKARESMEYFSSLRFIPEIVMNPAEFLLDLATGQVNDISVPEDLLPTKGTSESERLIIRYLQHKYKIQLEPKEKKENHQTPNAPAHLQIAIQVKKDWTLSWWQQFLILSKRTYKERCRDYFDKLRLFQALGVAILLGLLWWKSVTATEAQLRDQANSKTPTLTFYSSLLHYSIFEKHSLSGELQIGLMFYICIFWTSSSIFGAGAGELFGAAVMSIRRAGMIASLILLLFLLTGGYYVQHIPKFMRWLKYVSFMYYGFRLLLKVQYSGDELYECGSEGGCKTLQSSPSFDTVNLNGGLREVWVLLAMALAYRCCAYFCLRRNVNICNL